MRADETYGKLCEFTDLELKYKQDYLGAEKILGAKSAKLYNSEQHPRRYAENYFADYKHKNVLLQKHNRYLPQHEHDHEFFEILYVLDGECEHSIFGNADLLKKGDLCVITPSVKHTIWTDSGIVINFIISPKLIQSAFSGIFASHGIISDFFMNSIYLDNFASCILFRTGNDSSIAEHILEMYAEQEKSDEYSESIIGSMLMIFFNKLVRSYGNTAYYPKPLQKHSEQVAHILGLIVSDSASITLPKIADTLGYSTVYTSKYIKQLTGFSYSELHKRIRMQKAEELLLNTSLSIGEISQTLGYLNPENFNRAFRAEHTISPSLFRERVKV